MNSLRLTLLMMLATALPAAAIDPAFAGKNPAPEFPEGLEWLNTDKPVKLADLRGKFVMLDFWTYCCINCIHVLPDLHKLEQKYPNELVVVGVHSAKFTTEQGTANIREAILRYGIEHPVLNDKDFAAWNAFDAKGWPTFVLIDPAGNIVRKKSGEGIFAMWDPVIGEAIKAWDAEKKIDRRPIKWALEKDKAPRSLLAFPGKISADAAGNRLAISDSNHNRVLILDAAGKVLEVIGAGTEGLKDGAFDLAQFNKPQGVAFGPAGDVVFIADTENHTVRVADLAKRSVRTLAGNGKQATRSNVPGVGVDVALNSPWDLLPIGNYLYVAMAGPHQIWRIEISTQTAEPYAGSSRENLKDGPLGDAQLAQPSGITTDGKKLYFADSEVSAVRSADLDEKAGQVRTLIGQGLFDFGDKDGKLEGALLQHPLGVLYRDGEVLVADTYNNKIKCIDLNQKTIQTLIGLGKDGYKDGAALQAELNEPNGLAIAGGKLFIADTNNHAVRVYDFAAKTLSTLKITGLEKMTKATHKSLAGPVTRLPAQRVGPGDTEISIAIELPPGHKFNADAPLYLGLSAGDAKTIAIPADAAERNIASPTPMLKTPVRLSPGATSLGIDLVVYYCESGDKEGLCLVKTLRFEVPIEVAGDAAAKSIEVKIPIRR